MKTETASTIGRKTFDFFARIVTHNSRKELEVGKRADLIQVAFEDVHHIPTFDVVSHLVYVSDEQDVVSVVVDGNVLMREREMLTIDTNRVASEATVLAARIQDALATRNRD